MLRLRAIYGIAVAAELAWREQAAERDSEIVDCLRAGICDPIADRIGELEGIISPFHCSSLSGFHTMNAAEAGRKQAFSQPASRAIARGHRHVTKVSAILRCVFPGSRRVPNEPIEVESIAESVYPLIEVATATDRLEEICLPESADRPSGSCRPNHSAGTKPVDRLLSER